jgi:hypothetical protein
VKFVIDANCLISALIPRSPEHHFRRCCRSKTVSLRRRIKFVRMSFMAESLSRRQNSTCGRRDEQCPLRTS